MTSQPPLPSTSQLPVLRELGIPGRSPQPIYDDVWGLNIGAVRDNFPRHGLQCLAGPWGNMDVGDLLKIFWGTGTEVLREAVDEEEKGKELTLFVPADRIRDGLHEVSYSVRRLGGVDDPSEVMQVFVKLTRPGGQDENAGPGHSHLHMVIPKEILDGGIDKDNVTVGVPITILPYREMAVGDVIQVTWGGKFVLSEPLTKDQAAGISPIVVLIDEVTIRAAGDSDSSGLAVAFEVYDLVDNRSEDWCAEQRVVVDTGSSRLTAPIVKGAVNNILDLDKPGDGFTTVQIVVMDEPFELGDIIILRVRGTPLEGAPVDFEVEGEPLDNVPSIVELKVSNDQLRQLAQTQVVFSYRLQKADGSADLQSKGRFVSVIGEIRRLLAPIATDALQGAINPDLPYTRIEIPFDTSFVAGQAIKLFWLGTRPNQSIYLPDLGLRPITDGDIKAEESLFITVQGEHLKTLEGGTLELYYQLLSEDAVLGTLNRVNATHAIRESEHLPRLNVGPARMELPEPEVEGVVNGVLDDPDRPGTTLTVVYLDTSPGDEVIYQWLGSKTGTASDSVTLNSFTAGKKVPFSIKAELIKGNEGGTVTAFYSIKPEVGATKYSNPLEFSVGVLVTPAITSVKDPQQVEIPHGATTTATSVTLTGTATANLQVQIFNGANSLGPVTVGPNGIWTLPVNGLSVTPHSFTAKALYDAEPVSSPPRTLTVILEFTLDTSDLNLTGKNYTLRNPEFYWSHSKDNPPGTAAIRPASGGLLPYTYYSASDQIASVDSSGLVRSEGNGTTTITASDSAGHFRTFKVNTANVTEIIMSNDKFREADARQWVSSVGGIPFPDSGSAASQELGSIIKTKYIPTASRVFHTGVLHPTDPRWILRFVGNEGNYFAVSASLLQPDRLERVVCLKR